MSNHLHNWKKNLFILLQRKNKLLKIQKEITVRTEEFKKEINKLKKLYMETDHQQEKQKLNEQGDVLFNKFKKNIYKLTLDI